MGLNVIVERPGVRCSDHPDWDDGRMGVDRKLWDVMRAIEIEQKEADGFPWQDDGWWWRPADFAAFRAVLPAHEDYDRFRHLADILEADPRYWIRMSI